jgi:hypothetical protein
VSAVAPDEPAPAGADGFFGSFVGALLAIPAAGARQVITRELWQASARPQ